MRYTVEFSVQGDLQSYPLKEIGAHRGLYPVYYWPQTSFSAAKSCPLLPADRVEKTTKDITPLYSPELLPLDSFSPADLFLQDLHLSEQIKSVLLRDFISLHHSNHHAFIETIIKTAKRWHPPRVPADLIIVYTGTPFGKKSALLDSSKSSSPQDNYIMLVHSQLPVTKTDADVFMFSQRAGQRGEERRTGIKFPCLPVGLTGVPVEVSFNNPLHLLRGEERRTGIKFPCLPMGLTGVPVEVNFNNPLHLLRREENETVILTKQQLFAVDRILQADRDSLFINGFYVLTGSDVHVLSYPYYLDAIKLTGSDVNVIQTATAGKESWHVLSYPYYLDAIKLTRSDANVIQTATASKGSWHVLSYPYYLDAIKTEEEAVVFDRKYTGADLEANQAETVDINTANGMRFYGLLVPTQLEVDKVYNDLLWCCRFEVERKTEEMEKVFFRLRPSKKDIKSTDMESCLDTGATKESGTGEIICVFGVHGDELWDDIHREYGPRTDRLQIPPVDFNYSLDKLYDKNTGKPYFPLTSPDLPEVLVEYPSAHPINKYADVGLKIVNVHLWVFRDVAILLHRDYKEHMLQYEALPPGEAVRVALDRLYRNLRIFDYRRDEYLRSFRMVRWFGEYVIVATNDYLLVRDYETWISHEASPNRINGLPVEDQPYIAQAQGWYTDPSLPAYVAQGEEGLLELSIENLLPATFSFTVEIENRSGEAQAQFFVDDKNKSFLLAAFTRAEATLPTGRHSIVFKFRPGAEDDSMKLNSMKVDYVHFKSAEVIEKPKEGYNGAQALEMLIGMLVRYYDLHHQDKSKGSRMFTLWTPAGLSFLNPDTRG